MTILQINKFYYEKGGAERYYFELSKLLEENGHKIIPFAMQSNNNLKSKFSKYFVSEISTRPTWNIFKNLKTIFRFWWSREAQRKIHKLICDNKIDIAHMHNIYHQISPSILPILKKYKIPVIMTVHDYHLISSNYNLYQGKRLNTYFIQHLICTIERFLHHSILNIYKKNIDLFIAPSKFVADKLINAGFNKDKIKVVPHFIYKDIKTQKKQRYSKKENYILYFGRISEEKGVQILIEAMRKLPDVKLKIVGDGPEKKNYELRIKNYGLKNIEMLGYKDKDELQQLILNSELIVVPSLTPETFGLSVLESMALGKCVVASNIGALPELINKEFLFKPGNSKELAHKLSIILTNRPKYAIMNGQENREKAEQRYAEKKHYNQILAIYKQIKPN